MKINALPEYSQSISNNFKRGSQNVNTNLSQKEAQSMDDTGNPCANERKKESKDQRHGR